MNISPYTYIAAMVLAKTVHCLLDYLKAGFEATARASGWSAEALQLRRYSLFPYRLSVLLTEVAFYGFLASRSAGFAPKCGSACLWSVLFYVASSAERRGDIRTMRMTAALYPLATYLSYLADIPAMFFLLKKEGF